MENIFSYKRKTMRLNLNKFNYYKTIILKFLSKTLVHNNYINYNSHLKSSLNLYITMLFLLVMYLMANEKHMLNLLFYPLPSSYLQLLWQNHTNIWPIWLKWKFSPLPTIINNKKMICINCFVTQWLYSSLCLSLISNISTYCKKKELFLILPLFSLKPRGLSRG